MQGNLIRVADDLAIGGQSSVKGSSGALHTKDKAGESGVTVTTNTTAVSGSYSSIQILDDATFSAFSEDGADGQAMTGFIVPAGTVLYGKITGYTLSSGKVRAYKV